MKPFVTHPLIFALCRDPEGSAAIGYHAIQQNLAYNAAVDVLNREPNLPKRSGRNHPDAINKRITAWRQADRHKANAPYHIYQQGSEEAWEANQRLQQSRGIMAEKLVYATAGEFMAELPAMQELTLTEADPRC
ncbi:MAG: hypothetical protein OXN21_11365 [Chloroflexota bacterium]|nr:hypothetical protein [Chloroflexota bacterium]